MSGSLLDGRQIVVLAEDLYEDLELWYPVLRFREEGARVVVAGTGARRYRGKNGYPVEAEMSAENVSARDYDAIVIPGGYAPDRLRRYSFVIDLVREMAEHRKVIAAICHAAWVPISAGILRGRRMTCFHAIRDDVTNAGAEYVDAEVVRDDNLITSRQPSDLGAFCREIIATLSERRS